MLPVLAAVVVALVHGLPAAAQTTDARTAERTYRADCAVCHGADGRGTNQGPSLEGVGPASVDYYLSTGRMPLAASGRTLDPGRAIEPLPGRQQLDPDATPERHVPAYDPEQVDDLVDYVTELAGGGGPAIPDVDVGAADLARGGDLFRLQCAACHAWAGDGGALAEREAPSLHQATPRQIGEALRVGPGTMPVFGTSALSDDELNDVAAYVRYLDDPRDRGGFPLWHLGPVAEGAVALLVGLPLLVLFLFRIGVRG